MSETSAVVLTKEEWVKVTLAPYLLHACGSLAVILLLVWQLQFRGGFSFESPEVFNYHPVFEGLAFVLIVPESILLFRFSGFKTQNLKPFHALLHTFALITALFGFLAVFMFHADKEIPHFHSMHSVFGIATLAIFSLQYFSGWIIFYRLAAERKRQFKRFHPLFGGLIICTAGATVLTGILEKITFVGACQKEEMTDECRLVDLIGFIVLFAYLALGTALSAANFYQPFNDVNSPNELESQTADPNDRERLLSDD